MLSTVPTQANIGNTISITIPVKGKIEWDINFQANDASVSSGIVFGLRIGSTNYWPTSTRAGSLVYSITGASVGGGNTDTFSSIGLGNIATSSNANPQTGGSLSSGIFVEASGIPTGAQTVQPIVGMATSAGSVTIKGTVVVSRIYISVYDFT